jgi:uncharacterized protein (TIGR03086 family)
MSDTAQRYRLIASGFDSRVNAISGDGWNAPSPCAEWSARGVVGHVVGNHRWLAAKVRGGEPEPMTDEEDPAEAWRGAYGAVLAMTEDPAAMATMVEGPMGEMPFEQMLGNFVCMDVLVHTWDLARAVGADERLDEASVIGAYETMKPLDDQMRQPGVFDPKLEPPAGADTQTEFLYFLGRRA